MVSQTEYLILSFLSYCYFSDDDKDKSISDLLIGESNEVKKNKKRILITSEIFKKLDYYNYWDAIYPGLEKILSKWTILEICDKTETLKSKEKSNGFYSIVFAKKYGKDIEDIVIAFRGSELFPLKEAYKDYLGTDIFLGFGKRPIQFNEGLNFYKDLICKYDYKKINITGHSLGGGIAQYVSAMSQFVTNDFNFTPETITFNGIGILSESMIDYVEILKLKENELERYSEFNLEEIREIEKVFYFYLINKINSFSGNEKFVKGNLYLNDTEKILIVSQLKLKRIFKLKDNNILLFIENYYKYTIENKLHKLKLIDNNFRFNKNYEGKVISYIHSKDFTASYFRQLGKTIEVDKNFRVNDNKIKRNISEKAKIFTKAVDEFHMFDVFVPFLEESEEGKDYKGCLRNELNYKYVVSALRKLLYYEKQVDNELLICYYSLKREFNELELLELKKRILKSIKKIDKKLFKYKKLVIEYIEKIENDRLVFIWNKCLESLVSPYKHLNIFDVIVFEYV